MYLHAAPLTASIRRSDRATNSGPLSEPHERRHATPLHQALENPAQLPGRDAVVDFDGQGLARELVFHREDLELAAARAPIVQKIIRPDVIGIRGNHRLFYADAPAGFFRRFTGSFSPATAHSRRTRLTLMGGPSGLCRSSI